MTQAAGPTTIPDLPPGEYRIRVDARPLPSGRLFEESFELRPGECVAVAYDDNQGTRDALAELGVDVAKGTGIVVLVCVLVAADVAIVALSCGRCPPVCCRAAFGR